MPDLAIRAGPFGKLFLRGRRRGMLAGMDAPENRRWYYPTPGWLIYGSLLVTGLIWLSNWLKWPQWHKGYAVLVAVAGVGVVLAAMLLWWLAALVFRWRFQFSIRTLLVLTVAMALPFSWLGVEMKRARDQAKAVAALEEDGAAYNYDWRFDANGSYGGSRLLPAREWLRRPLGIDFFSEVVVVIYVNDDNGQLTQPDLSPLEGLKHLELLWLVGTKLTDVTSYI